MEVLWTFWFLIRIHSLHCSVADLGCLSRILIFTHPGSRISDPGSKNSNKRERWKKISCHTFLCSHKFHRIVNYFSFEVLKKKIWANFQTIMELFVQKIAKKLLQIFSWDPGSGIRDPGSGIRDPGSGIRDPGSGKNLFRIPDPRSRGQKGTWSRIQIRNTAPLYPDSIQTRIRMILIKLPWQNYLKVHKDENFFWLRFWILYYLIVSYVQILRFYTTFFDLATIGEIRLFRLVWD